MLNIIKKLNNNLIIFEKQNYIIIFKIKILNKIKYIFIIIHYVFQNIFLIVKNKNYVIFNIIFNILYGFKKNKYTKTKTIRFRYLSSTKS